MFACETRGEFDTLNQVSLSAYIVVDTPFCFSGFSWRGVEGDGLGSISSCLRESGFHPPLDKKEQNGCILSLGIGGGLGVVKPLTKFLTKLSLQE